MTGLKLFVNPRQHSECAVHDWFFAGRPVDFVQIPKTDVFLTLSERTERSTNTFYFLLEFLKEMPRPVKTVADPERLLI